MVSIRIDFHPSILFRNRTSINFNFRSTFLFVSVILSTLPGLHMVTSHLEQYLATCRLIYLDVLFFIFECPFRDCHIGNFCCTMLMHLDLLSGTSCRINNDHLFRQIVMPSPIGTLEFKRFRIISTKGTIGTC